MELLIIKITRAHQNHCMQCHSLLPSGDSQGVWSAEAKKFWMHCFTQIYFVKRQVGSRLNETQHGFEAFMSKTLSTIYNLKLSHTIKLHMFHTDFYDLNVIITCSVFLAFFSINNFN